MIVRGVGVRRRQYDWPHEPVIRTSEPALQRLFDAGINTLRNSALDSVVDGGGRERQQYSGDGGHQLHAIRYAFGEPRIAARFLRTFSEGLTKSGFFLDCYPAYDRLARLPQRELESAYWGPLLDHGVGFVFDNWHHYLETGDREAVREPFPRLLRFADYLWALRGGDGLLPVEDLGIANVWIDHDAYRNQRNRQCAFNLYAAAMYRSRAGAAGRGDGRRRRAPPRRACAATNCSGPRSRVSGAGTARVFLDNLPWLAEDKTPRMSDRALATAILFDQCPGGDTEAALRALVEMPPKRGPVVSVQRRLALLGAGAAGPGRCRPARFPHALGDDAFGDREQHAAGTVAGAARLRFAMEPLPARADLRAAQDIVGLRPLAPGFSRLQLRPQLGDLPDLHVMPHAARAGGIQGSTFYVTHHISVTLPPNCEAELLLPAGVEVPFRRWADAAPGLRRYRLPAGGGSFALPVKAASTPIAVHCVTAVVCRRLKCARR